MTKLRFKGNMEQWKALEEKRKKRKEYKDSLIDDVIDMLENQQYEYRHFISDLCREALQRRTNKELKELL